MKQTSIVSNDKKQRFTDMMYVIGFQPRNCSSKVVCLVIFNYSKLHQKAYCIYQEGRFGE